MPSPRVVLLASIVVTALVVSGVWYSLAPAIMPPKVVEKPVEKIVEKTGKLETVTLLLPWVPGGEHLPLYVALDQGFFANEGLSVTIIPGRGSVFAITNVDQGKVDFAWADTVAIIQQVAKGAKIKIVATIYAKHPAALASFAPLNSLKDVEGKSIGVSSFSSTRFLLPLIMKLSGADPAKIKEDLVDPNVIDQAFVQGKFDVNGEAWLGSDLPYVMSLAKKAGKELYVLRLADFGLALPFYMMIASEKMIRERPDLVRKMVKVALMGVGASLKMPDEKAVEILLKYVPPLGKEETLQQWLQTKELVVRYGAVDENSMANAVDVVVKAYNITQKIDPSTLYTNELVK